MITNTDLFKSIFMFVRDNLTKNIKNFIITSDTQIGTAAKPAALKMTGKINFSSMLFDVTDNSTIYIP